jgi:methyltransferase (TIGR00027 family)
MQASRASLTAQWVAAARSFGRFLPQPSRLVEDAYGIRFADGWLGTLYARAEARPGVAQQVLVRGGRVSSLVFYMQLRTKFIDDALRDFARAGGTQVVLLGAGFDVRAVRLASELPGVSFFEVDHPATQAVKRQRLPELSAARASLIAWDFERMPLDELPAALAGAGHDPRKPTLTVWEGVTMYLPREAIEATFAAVSDYSAPGSPLVFTYFDEHRGLRRPGLRARATAWLVASVGEPYRFGWDPVQLPTWLAARGYTLERDADAVDLADTWLPAGHRRRLGAPGRHFAVARR